jgi:AbrB family looped-hinge helix DNA binding protein
MSNLATTKLSSKGQIVIPEEIRNQMGLHTGDQFLVVAEKGVMILKTIEKPELSQYKGAIAKTRKLAKSYGLNKQDLSHAIKVARKK